MASLVDVNVLVALLHGGHPHSSTATQWLDKQDEAGAVVLCRVAQMGALRILTRPSIMKEDVLTPEAFWAGWELALADDRLRLEAEPASFEAAWRSVTLALPRGCCAETDAYLAAFALSGGWSVCTFDRGFTRFNGLKLELLG